MQGFFVSLSFFSPSLCTEGSATLVYKHIVNLSPACARVCTCVRVSGPTALHLALTLKRCQQVCDETSQTIPHLPLFHSGPSWLARPSDTLCSHLFLSPLRIFFLIISMSACFSATFLTTFLLFILHYILCVPSFLDIRTHAALAVL